MRLVPTQVVAQQLHSRVQLLTAEDFHNTSVILLAFLKIAHCRAKSVKKRPEQVADREERGKTARFHQSPVEGNVVFDPPVVGIGAELAAVVMEHAFDELDSMLQWAGFTPNRFLIRLVLRWRMRFWPMPTKSWRLLAPSSRDARRFRAVRLPPCITQPYCLPKAVMASQSHPRRWLSQPRRPNQ